MSDSAVQAPAQQKRREEISRTVIRFAGDSGDGMQLTGSQFATETAWAGTDLATLPNFPAEIRAPAGTLFGVSSFQIQFGSEEIHTPGDEPDVLVAMNPAALKVHLDDLKPGGILIANSNAFEPRNLAKAGYEGNPLDDEKLKSRYRLYSIEITKLTREAVAGAGVTSREAERAKNFFALGLMSWLFDRPLEPTIRWAEGKFKKIPKVLDGNLRALKAGHAYGETTEMFGVAYQVGKAPMSPGLYRQITGNSALAIGFAAAASRTGLPVVYGAYPITPASDILHELSMYKSFGVRTFQAEDEIAAMTAAIGASFAGAIGVTGTSGPGLALKGEAIGLAVMTELPVVIVDVQRGGPSTGLPTKTEQADLLQAMWGRNGECPVCVLAPSTPGDCFYMAYEAVRIAYKYMCPVILLSDGYLANGAEPWLVPDVEKLPPIKIQFEPSPIEPMHFLPYMRDEKTLARRFAIPGTPGLEHRVGGIEKEDITGNVNYEPENHEHMVKVRAEKIQRIVAEIPPLEVHGPAEGDLLVVGWGSTCGSITAACESAREMGLSVANTHLRHMNPLPSDLEGVLKRYRRVLVPEINNGQLSAILRARFCIPAIGYNRIRGLPLTRAGILEAIESLFPGVRA
ncbi:MAG: 2-oxoacid:acceptor oxidoreductase subunit alpha [Acidobacteriota bacterium]